MNLAIITLLSVLLVFNIGILVVVLRTWFSQKRSQQIRYWYDDEGKLQFDLDNKD
tara:strand:- start:387 stop:551 length:165 start_codon:yes stop_codon:yes gene_type:complete